MQTDRTLTLKLLTHFEKQILFILKYFLQSL